MTDYYNVNAYFNDEQLLIQSSVREWVNKSVKPKIGKYYQEGKPLPNVVRQLAEVGAFGLTIPQEYGGFGMDFMSFGIMMQAVSYTHLRAHET